MSAFVTHPNGLIRDDHTRDLSSDAAAVAALDVAKAKIAAEIIRPPSIYERECLQDNVILSMDATPACRVVTGL